MLYFHLNEHHWVLADLNNWRASLLELKKTSLGVNSLVQGSHNVQRTEKVCTLVSVILQKRVWALKEQTSGNSKEAF